MRIGRSATTALVMLGLLAGCQSWHGEAEVRLKTGDVIRCPEGLAFDRYAVVCYGAGMEARVAWSAVAGYTAR